MNLFQVTKKQDIKGYELRTMTGDIVSFTPSYSQLLPDPFSDLNVKVNVLATGGNGTPDNPNPINGYTEANITRCGVNLLGGETFADLIVDKVPNAVKDTIAKTITYEGQYIRDIPLFNKFKANTQYTFFIKRASGVANLKINYTDGTSSEIRTFPQTSANNKSILNLAGEWQSGTSVVSYDECGVFEGVKTLEDFEEYNGNTYTISFGQTVYGGVLDVTRGKLTVTWGKIDMGTLNDWYYWESRQVFNSSTTGKKIGLSNIKSDIYETITSGSYDTLTDGQMCGNVGNVGVYIKNLAYTDANAFKTAMSGHYLVYELATPFDIDLTPEQIEALLGVNNVYADCGNVTVTCLI